ncbi:MAG: erythromycin esterase family protein, partial [Bacteroidales bacterium]
MGHFGKETTRIDKNDVDTILRSNSHELERGLDPLFERIGDARIVLLGEASHGTHEYYLWRAIITRYLIEEKGFNIIGVKGDWPDCYRINRYIRNYENIGEKAVDVLKKFHRWPTWMWANWEISALMEWLKEYNTGRSFDKQA